MKSTKRKFRVRITFDPAEGWLVRVWVISAPGRPLRFIAEPLKKSNPSFGARLIPLKEFAGMSRVDFPDNLVKHQSH